MKTNQVMIRTIKGFRVHQRTKDGMFNATHLLSQWNKALGMKKEVTKFFELEQTKDFLEVLRSEENLNTQDSAYLANRGKQGGTWMHPLLFIKFAMWLNPKFEYYVIKFVYDQLITFRHLAGDHYRALGRAVAIFDNVDYARIAKGLNFIVFKKHEPELRQNATEQELKTLESLEEKLAFAITMGYIDSYKGLLKEMKRIYEVRDQYLAL